MSSKDLAYACIGQQKKVRTCFLSTHACFLKHGSLQACLPASDKALSRTTRIALDAQRARRGIKRHARSVSKAGNNSQPRDERRGEASKPVSFATLACCEEYRPDGNADRRSSNLNQEYLTTCRLAFQLCI